MYDFIGDIHGCYTELCNLLDTLGYVRGVDGYAHPDGRIVVSVGDLNDRGPHTADVYALAMNMHARGCLKLTQGNHDNKLWRYLKGNKVQLKHGLAQTVDQLKRCPPEFLDKLQSFLAQAPYRLLLDDGKVLACHAGLPERMHEANENGRIRDHALYGDVDGTVDAEGLPVRRDWAASYQGARIVVHGHVPVKEPDIRNNVYNIDTGCCFGNKLTALRYPEMQIVSVAALDTYSDKKVW